MSIISWYRYNKAVWTNCVLFSIQYHGRLELFREFVDIKNKDDYVKYIKYTTEADMCSNFVEALGYLEKEYIKKNGLMI